jgi:hypothetical protein
VNITLRSYSVDTGETPFDALPGPVSREKVLRLEEALKQLPPGDAPVTHHFSDGMYAREMLIPKGTILTGKIHRKAHLSVISKGDISVLTEHGVKRLKAPCILQSFPGIKRAGYAHEDTIWTTFHATHETDLDKIEAEFIAPSFEALDAELKVLEDET